MFASYSDGKTTHKIEVLGNGQQFVAYGIHPDTKKPYTWTSLDDPLGVNASDLPTLTHVDAQEIIEHFSIVCEERGWKKLSSTLGGVVRENDEADLDGIKPILALTDEKIRETLDLIPNEEADYDDWLTVGCALHHQFSGAGEGLELWHEWGQRSAKYDAADTNRRWRSFGRGPSTVTFATLLYRANEIKSRLEDKEFNEAIARINSTNDKKELTTKVASSIMQAVTNDLQYDEATKRLQMRLGELNDGNKPRLEKIEEHALLVLVVGRIAGRDFARPVEGKPHRLELLLHRRDVVVGPRLGMDLALHCGVLGRHAEGIPAHRMQHLEPAGPLVARHHIAQRVVADVAHVDAPGGVGEHLEHVALRARRAGALGKGIRVGGGKDALLLPHLLPVLLADGGVIALVLSVGGHDGAARIACILMGLACKEPERRGRVKALIWA